MTRLYVDEQALNRLLDQAENDSRLRNLVAHVRASVRTPPETPIKKIYKGRPSVFELPELATQFEEDALPATPVAEEVENGEPTNSVD